MALALNDRVQQTGTANTTVSFTLSGSVTGFQPFTIVGNGNTTYYAATDVSGNWEVGEGTYSTTGPTLTRNTILSSSNSGSAVTFSGTVNVFVTYPSSKAVFEDASGNVSALGTITSGTWQGSTIGVAYGGTGVTASSGPNSVVLRDANGNVAGVNNAIIGITFITSAGGTTNLVASSTQIQTVVGSANQTIRLPNATTLQVGQFYTISCATSGTVTVEDFAGGVIETITQGGASQVLCSSTATVAGTWGFRVFAASNVTWGNTALDYNGLITSATWQGDVIQSAYGGTGLSTFGAANYALYSTSASALVAGTLPVAAGGTGVTTSTGSGSVVLSTSPTLVTPALGTPSSGNLANCTFPTLNQNTTGNAATATTATTATNQSGGTVSATTGAFSGVASFAAGSAAAPAITRTGNTNTGIFFPSADNIAFTEGGAEVMRINSSGNVGIGTTIPADKLTVLGSVLLASGSANLYIGAESIRQSIDSNLGGFGWVDDSGSGATTLMALDMFNGFNLYTALTTTAGIYAIAGSAASPAYSRNADPNTGMFFPAADTVAFTTGGVERMRTSSTGGLSVGTTSAAGSGAIIATGNITAFFSDDRLKTRHGKIENALDKLQTLDGFYYTPNQTAQDLGYEAKQDIGVSAQAVQAILPEVVAPAPIDDKYLTVRYEKLVPLLIEAIKELKAEVDRLKKSN